MKPFNLEKALAGAKLVTRDGREVTGFKRATKGGQFPYTAVVSGCAEMFSDEGRYYRAGQNPADLFLADVELKAGMWVKCVKSVSDKEAGKWYPLYDEIFTSATGTTRDLVIKGDKEYITPVSSANGWCFDLDNPLDEKPAPEKAELKVGMWVKCLENTLGAAGPVSTYTAGGWYLITYVSGDCARVQDDTFGDDNLYSTVVCGTFDWNNPLNEKPVVTEALPYISLVAGQDEGKWVRCIKSRGDRFSTGRYYRIDRFDQLSRPGDYSIAIDTSFRVFVIKNTEVAVEYFDFSTLLPENPDSIQVAPTPVTAQVVLVPGMWVACVSQYRPPYLKETPFNVGEYYQVGETTDISSPLTLDTSKGFICIPGNRHCCFDLYNPLAYNPATTAAAPTQPDQPNVLEEAQKLIYGEREADYGSVSENFSNIAAGWQVIFGTTVTPEQVGLAMAWLKIARQTNKPKRDNLVDAAGYIGCVDKIQKRL